MHSIKPSVVIRDDLTILLGGAAVRVSPSEGLRLAEQLTRTSFRRALVEEAERVTRPKQRITQ